MTRLAFSILIAFASLAPIKDAFSQTIRDSNNNAFSPRLSGEVVNYNVPTKGSQYLYQDWLPARVLLQSGESVEVASLRYNGYHNTVVWRHPKTHSHIRLDDQLIKEFSLDHPAKTARFVRFQVPGSIETILAESLFDEDVRLLARRNIEQTDRVIESYEGTMVSVPVLEPRPEYYVINAEGEVTRISRLNRRNLQNAFPGNERNIRQLLRQHSLRIQNETELLEAVHLINEVLTKEGG